MNKKRVAVVGSRDYNDKFEIFKYLDTKIDKIGHLVSGGCPTGADSIAQIYAKERGLSITIHYPNWDKDGKGAGFIRNKRIVEDCDILIAWHANQSKGTQNSITLAQKLGKKVIIHNVEPDNLENDIAKHKERTKNAHFGEY
ncbi:MAG: SLOG family protein [bacterium]|nr:SLOG family protein [bacterium]